ncbi:MAG TPA: aminoacyl-tRNA hydrolase [Clostridiaceae bacterium]|nr:aminoacyl-tRNA hydrolase [Clostridiaceae bacterium]
MEDFFLIAGLGNPGKKYDNTRHNVGFDTIDMLSYKFGIKVNKLKFKALTGEGSIEGKRVLLLKPQTFMNLSGESVREAVEWYKPSLNNLIIIYDDIDIPLGKIRVRAKGSAGSHNGMKSVIYQIQSDEFPRVRIGIDKPPENWDLADYVLSKFNEQEREVIDNSIKRAAEAVVTIIKSGTEAAMNLYNG